MPGHAKFILDTFPHLSPSLNVTRASSRLKEAAKQQGLNVGYGVVVDSTGFPLACLNTTMLANWPELQPLSSQRAVWPVLHTLPRVHVSNSDAGMYLVARFFQEEIGSEDFVGIVLLDEAGKPDGILRKRVLTDILAGAQTRSSSGERLSQAIVGVPAEGELQVKRYAHLHFPAQVQLYQRCQLSIAIKRNPPEDGTRPWELGLRRKDWPLKVVATLWLGQDQNDFRVEGPLNGTIEVPQNDDSKTLTFTLIPQSLGNKKIRILFEQNGTHLRVAEILAEVVQAEPETTTTAQILFTPQISEWSGTGSTPNVTIHIEKVKEFVYNVRVRTSSDPPGSEERLIDQIVFDQRPDAFLERWFQLLNEKNKTGLTLDKYDREVKKIGEHLFLDFLHDDPEDPTRRFQRFYWREMHPLPEGSYVQIVSDEPYIPWEILRPRRKNEDGQWDKGDEPFLCQRFALARWFNAQQNGPARLDLQKIALVAPSSNLEWVKPEVDAISKIGRLTEIKDLPQLEEFLQHGEADVLHFACHGKFQSTDPERSVVILGNSSFRPWDLTPDFYYFGSKRPLVFMNACDSGREGIGLAGLDGWATAFVGDAKVGFFIGSVWKTTDELACQFAKVFYDLLQHRYTIGEAARLARKAIEISGDATYLSYTVYANPLAQLGR